MKRRRGFVLLWAVFAMAAAVLVGSGLFFCLFSLMEHEKDTEIVNEEALLAQDAMEREKYNVRFGGHEPRLSGRVTRNGRTYEVDWEWEARDIEGVPMQELTCHVTHESGRTFSVTTLVEKRNEE